MAVLVLMMSAFCSHETEPLQFGPHLSLDISQSIPSPHITQHCNGDHSHEASHSKYNGRIKWDWEWQTAGVYT